MPLVPMAGVGAAQPGAHVAAVTIPRSDARADASNHRVLRLGERLPGDIELGPFERDSHIPCRARDARGAACDGGDIAGPLTPPLLRYPADDAADVLDVDESRHGETGSMPFDRPHDETGRQIVRHAVEPA